MPLPALERLTIVVIAWLGLTVSGPEIRGDLYHAGPDDVQAKSKADADGGSEPAPKKKSDGKSTTKKTSARGKGAKKKTDRGNPSHKTPDPDSDLSMEPGVVCKSIDGYENYEPLPGAAQTSDEKLLVYVRPTGFKTEKVDGGYQAHLAPDFEVRKSGAKSVLLQKKKMFEYKPRGTEPPYRIYLKNVISLKGLTPGDYELTIILHDEIAKGPPATQVIKFKVIPPQDPSTSSAPLADASG